MAASATLTGPAGGTWVESEATIFCPLCREWQPRGWRYFVGAVSHAQVCDECARSAVAGGKETHYGRDEYVDPYDVDADWEECHA